MLAVDEVGDQHRASLEVRYGVVDRQALSRVVAAGKEPQDAGVAFGPGPRPSGRERPSDPRVPVGSVHPEHIGAVNADLRRSHSVDAIATPQVRDEAVGGRVVEHARLEALEIGERFGVALAGLVRVSADDLLEVAGLRH